MRKTSLSSSFSGKEGQRTESLDRSMPKSEGLMQFVSVKDIADAGELVREALALKQTPAAYRHIGKNKTLGLIFLNPSLRTRMSTQKAAYNLGMDVISVSMDKEGWAIEFEEGAVMNSDKTEHIKEAAAVIGQYCDIAGIRCFPGLTDRDFDYSETVLNQFIRYCGKPVISLESATLHPLQSLADLITITEHWQKKSKPKVVLTWAPHVKPLPQAVANSFAEWMLAADADFVIAHPQGYELSEKFTKGAVITSSQEEALRGADFVYVKSWSSFRDYGSMPPVSDAWMLTREKLKITSSARVMHCLPVRRNVELPDEILDGSNTLILQQAENRVYAAQAVLKRMLESL
ncbi:MAG TPA: hypothetical protein VNJ07_00445 [Chitinophagales bacterium]|nr:hypothetical protein [Chitinophagales bacterium]